MVQRRPRPSGDLQLPAGISANVQECTVKVLHPADMIMVPASRIMEPCGAAVNGQMASVRADGDERAGGAKGSV